jgi:hypothetical protein
MARDDLLLEFLFGVFLENGTSANHNVKHDHHAFIKSLDIRERRLRFAAIPRRSLVDCRQSAFMRLYQSGSNQALIVATGLNHRCFVYVLHRFIPIFKINTPHSPDGIIRFKKDARGCKRRISPTMCLGLVLMWTRTSGSTSP